MRRLADNGYLKPPPLYEFIKNLPELSSLRESKAKSVSYPEDSYIQALYEIYPEIKSEPVDLNSFTPPLVRRFAWQQMEFIKKGHSPQKAFEMTEAYFKDEIKKTQESVSAVATSIGIVQKEEERVLLRALRQHRERKERQLQSSIPG